MEDESTNNESTEQPEINPYFSAQPESSSPESFAQPDVSINPDKSLDPVEPVQPIKKPKKKLIIISVIAFLVVIIGIIVFFLLNTKPDSINSDKTQEYSVLFKVDDKTISEVKLSLNSKIESITPPEKEGFIFDNWYLNDEVYDFSKAVTSDVTLEARWKAVYTATFNTDGGDSIPITNVIEKEKVTKPADPTKKGYKFKEWQVDGKAFDFDSEVLDNIILTATWKKNAVAVTPAVTKTTATAKPAVVAPAAPAAPTYRYTKEQVLEKLDAVIASWPPEYKVMETRYIPGPLMYWDDSIVGTEIQENTSVGGDVAFNTANHTLTYNRYMTGVIISLNCVYSFRTKSVTVKNNGDYPGFCPDASLFEAEFTKLLSEAGVTSDEYLQW